MRENNGYRFETDLIHKGIPDFQGVGSLVPPIYQTSTFVFKDAEQGEARFSGKEAGYIYSRLANPTVRVFENMLATLEKGEAALAFASGMAAVSAVLTTLTKTGDHILCSQGIYGCTFGLLQSFKDKYQIDHSFSSLESKDEVLENIRENTACIFIETPINPTMRLVDLEMVAEAAGEQGIPVVVDNTFASPYLQKPLLHGCDVVIHSATKYIGGHGDVLGGIAVGRRDFIEKMAKTVQKDMGGILSPFDAWLLIRGLKTLAVRMDRHSENAEKLASFLAAHPKIEQVFYPGDMRNPDWLIMKKQMEKPGGLISFSLKGTKETAQQFMNNLRLIKIAVSLGDPETLIQHPATMTHAVVPREERYKMGISDTLMRLSAGLEAWEDLRDDIRQALEKI